MLVAETAKPVRFAAVVAHTRPAGSYAAWARDKVQWHGPVRLLRVVAVHVDFQGRGLGHESMEKALDDITDREDGKEVLVISLVHEGNKRSQAMITSQHFELAPFPLDGDPEMQVWFGNF
ncbi:GNAT family N-acetyltransferase [Streptomyces sp. NPDC046332]|uniref:GNAT family N-acetyltransferase n=1 Tax=Streptomyces sp. NPDC046332 TaxID=3155133 RepID=UPI0033CFBEEA